MYLLTNNKDSKLGDSPLPDGTVRVFRDNGRDGLSYLSAQNIKYIPVGDKIELNLGPIPNVIFELIKLRAFRDDIWMQVNGANVFRRVGQPGVQIEANSARSPAGTTTRCTPSASATTRPSPIEVEVRRTFPGHVVFRSQLKATMHDYQTPEFKTTVDAGKKADLLFEVVRHHEGHNAHQDNVTLENTRP
jgi:hypothetical protein